MKYSRGVFTLRLQLLTDSATVQMRLSRGWPTLSFSPEVLANHKHWRDFVYPHLDPAFSNMMMPIIPNLLLGALGLGQLATLYTQFPELHGRQSYLDYLQFHPFHGMSFRPGISISA